MKISYIESTLILLLFCFLAFGSEERSDSKKCADYRKDYYTAKRKLNQLAPGEIDRRVKEREAKQAMRIAYSEMKSLGCDLPK